VKTSDCVRASATNNCDRKARRLSARHADS
jgi:hypothetical protein